MSRPLIHRTPKQAEAFKQKQLADRRNRRAKQREQAANDLELERIADAFAGKGELALVEGKVPGAPRKGRAALEAARDAVSLAFEALGGTDGLVAFGKKYPKEFYTQIWSKLIPRVNEAEIGEGLEDVLRAMGNGEIPGMHQKALTAGSNAVEAEFDEVDEDDE